MVVHIKTEPGAGEMAQQLTAGVPLAEGLNWVPSGHIEQLILPVTPAPGNPVPLASAGTYTHMYISTHRQKTQLKIKQIFKKKKLKL